MVETIEVISSAETRIDQLNIPVIFVEDNENNEVNGLTINGLDGDHYSPSVRVVYITKENNTDTGFGFHLSRSKWDPYPYISGVDKSSPASSAGLKEGDCLLEVNGEDVLGMRVADVASLVKAKLDHVGLLLWNTNLDQACESNLCCGPMPLNYEKLAATVQTILTAIECPVCFNTIPSPFTQCQNGHLLCLKCRARSDRCPICRDRYSVVRCLLAEQIYTTLIETFQLHDGPNGKIREKIFGAKTNKIEERQKVFEEMPGTTQKIHSHTQKFLAKIMGKASSMQSLSQQNDTKGLNVNGGMMKNKSVSLSQSTSNIFRPDATAMSIIRCPSLNRNLGAELSTSCGSLIGIRRPLSCNASTESLPNLVPPKGTEVESFYCCPSGDDCFDAKLTSSSLIQHINEIHHRPTISFGTSSAEISLPPRSPIENASLILVVDGKQFWIKVVADSNNDLFVSCLMQAPFNSTAKYVLEVALRKFNADRIRGMELINRNEIYCLEAISWREIFTTRRGIKLSHENIQSTFGNAEINLKASIRRIEDI